MRIITEVGQEPNQKLNLIGENNERIDFVLRYKPSQQAWYFDISYESFSVNGIKVVNSPNLLRQYENIIPFGLGCSVTDGTDPYFIDDFTDGRATLALLNEADIQQIEEELFS